MAAMTPYIIKVGDFLSKLAHTLGFDADAVWNDPKNADLKSRRPDRDLLVAGDILFVPEKERKKLPFVKESDNGYVAKVPKLEVSLMLEHDGKPLANEEYTIEGLGDDTTCTTDEDGAAVIKAPIHVREVVVRLTKKAIAYSVRLGDLDPPDTPSGARMRLTHLGIYVPPAPAAGGDAAARDQKQLDAAVSEFQRRNGIHASGDLDDATQKALVDAHGS